VYHNLGTHGFVKDVAGRPILPGPARPIEELV